MGHSSWGQRRVLQILGTKCQYGGHHCEWIWCQLLESDWVCGHPWPVVSYWSECWGLQCPVTGVGTAFVTKSSKCGTTGSVVLRARCWNRAAGHSQSAWCQLLGVCGGRCLYLPQVWCAWGYVHGVSVGQACKCDSTQGICGFVSACEYKVSHLPSLGTFNLYELRRQEGTWLSMSMFFVSPVCRCC